MQTSVIKYNLRERGRQFRGQARNFNIAAVVQAINSDACQEKVRNRDMIGFYGHWPRIKFGMNPREGGLEKGRPAFVEPAIVTTLLKAYPDGTIEHQEEFLDTDSGKLAAKLYKSRVGGFSSVIGNGKVEFFGFDYVNEPNYSTNRGYALDSVDMSEDEIEAAIFGESIRGVMALIDSAENQIVMANETIDNLRNENAQLVDLLAARGMSADSIYAEGIALCQIDNSETVRLMDDVQSFWNMKDLPKLNEHKTQVELDPVSKHLLLRGH